MYPTIISQKTFETGKKWKMLVYRHKPLRSTALVRTLYSSPRPWSYFFFPFALLLAGALPVLLTLAARLDASDPALDLLPDDFTVSTALFYNGTLASCRSPTRNSSRA